MWIASKSRWGEKVYERILLRQSYRDEQGQAQACLVAALTITHLRLKDGSELHQVPMPHNQSQALLNALGITLPSYISTLELRAATKQKLPSRYGTH